MPSPPVSSRKRSAELQRARRGDVRLVESQRAQDPPLRRARGHEHLGAQMPASCTAAIPTPPVAACTSTRSPAFKRPDRPARSRRSRTRSAPSRPARTTIPPAPARAAWRSVTPTGPTPREHPHHPIADGETVHPGTELEHHPRALAANSCAAPGYMPSAINTSRKFSPPARTATRTSPGSSAPADSGAGRARPSSVPLSVRAQPPLADSLWDLQKFAPPTRASRGARIVPSRIASWDSPVLNALASSLQRGARPIGVDERESLGVLRLRAARQSPHGRLREPRGVFTGAHGHGAFGEQDQVGVGQTLL